MEKSKTSIIWKTSDCRAKQNEIWDSWLTIQDIRGSFAHLVFKVILRSLGALQFFVIWA